MGETDDYEPRDPAIGLIGLRLAADGYRTIDGIDLSPAMIEQTTVRGCYRRLTGDVDITAPLPNDLPTNYDIVIAGGLFTVGHIEPEALETVASFARPGGLAIITTRLRYYTETAYQAVSDRLQSAVRLQLLRRNAGTPYTLDSPGHYWAYLVNR